MNEKTGHQTQAHTHTLSLMKLSAHLCRSVVVDAVLVTCLFDFLRNCFYELPDFLELNRFLKAFRNIYKNTVNPVCNSEHINYSKIIPSNNSALHKSRKQEIIGFILRTCQISPQNQTKKLPIPVSYVENSTYF